MIISKNKKTRFLLCAVTAVILTISCFLPLSVSATVSEEDDHDIAGSSSGLSDNGISKKPYAFFEVSEDENTITSEGTTYTRFDISSAYQYAPRYSVYFYYRNVILEKGGNSLSYSLESPGDGVLVARHNTDIIFYLTDSARAKVNDLISGKGKIYRIERGNKTAVIDRSFSDRLGSYVYENKECIEKVDVSHLKNMNIYTIRAFDASDSICTDIGCIYEGNKGELYYLKVTALENNQFDAEGNISYRNGTLDVIPIKSEFGEEVSAAIAKMKHIYVDETIEYSLFNDNSDDLSNTLAVLFWPTYIIVGFLVPVPALIFGIINPLKKKNRHSKCWFVLASLGALWIITALSILLCFIL